MKNLIKINTLAECYSCNKNMFVCYTPGGADFNTCPCCKQDDFYNSSYLYDKEIHKQYFDKFKDDDENIYSKFSFCSQCKIIFDVGCTHSENGCTDDCYNAHFIAEYKYKDSIYTGMPQFESIDEWYHELENIIILKWICINNRLRCNKSRYPVTYGCNITKNGKNIK